MKSRAERAVIEQYLADITQQFESGHAAEHAYRPALQQLVQAFPDTLAVNDPKRSEHGAPDFVFLKASNANIVKGYAEAKDIGKNLDLVERSNQMQRYAGYANLFLTDYIEFRFYKNGQRYQTISLGDVKAGRLVLAPQHGERLVRELQAFLTLAPETITSGKRLAEIMGAKARRLRDNVASFLGEQDPESTRDLTKIYRLMKNMLVHDLSVGNFSDMYAQTLVYGLFVALF